MINLDVCDEFTRCGTFLKNNNWIESTDNDYILFDKDDCISIDFDLKNNEMIFIDEEGDFLSKTINYYTLIGVLLEYRQLPMNYKSVNEVHYEF